MIPFRDVLTLGSKGTQPIAVKRGLYRAGFHNGWSGLDCQPIAEPVLGTLAVTNLKRWQGYWGLDQDGVYGPDSHHILQGSFDAYATALYLSATTATVQLPETFTPTHDTAGLPGYPAIDVFAKAGTRVLAPADGTCTRSHLIDWDVSKRIGGWTTYLVAAKGTYFLTHFGDVLPTGSKVRKGQDMGSIGRVPGGAWEAHIHEGFHADV